MGDVVSSHLDEDRREMITGKMSTVARYNNNLLQSFDHVVAFKKIDLYYFYHLNCRNQV